MLNKSLIITLGAAVSGLVSNLYLGLQLEIWPGLSFGVTTGLLFWLLYRVNPARLILWVLASVLSWYVALQAYLLKINLFTAENDLIGIVLAGLLGALLLGVAFKLFVNKNLSLLNLLGCVAVGGLTAFAVSVYGIMTGTGLAAGGISGSVNGYALFVLWQAGVAFVLAFRLEHPPVPGIR